MLDNLQDQDSSPFLQNEGDNENNEISSLGFKPIGQKKNSGKFLGFKSHQVFILLVMLLIVIFLTGAMFLLVTGKIVPSFL